MDRQGSVITIGYPPPSRRPGLMGRRSPKPSGERTHVHPAGGLPQVAQVRESRRNAVQWVSCYEREWHMVLAQPFG